MCQAAEEVPEKTTEKPLGRGKEDDSWSKEEQIEFEWSVPARPPSRRSTQLAFSSAIFPAQKGVAVFPLLSKINHSCAPNCFVVWSRDNSAQLVAAADLPAGAELSIDYLGDRADEYTGARRRRWLEAQYGFVCSCSKCRDALAACP